MLRLLFLFLLVRQNPLVSSSAEFAAATVSESRVLLTDKRAMHFLPKPTEVAPGDRTSASTLCLLTLTSRIRRG